MARVKIESIIYELSGEIRGALNESVRRVLPTAEFNSDDLFREFMKALDRHSNTWERVPNDYVVLEKVDPRIQARIKARIKARVKVKGG